MRPCLPGFPLLLLGPSRAISSAGRAPPRQGGGHWFEPSIAHLESPAPAGFRRFGGAPRPEHLSSGGGRAYRPSPSGRGVPTAPPIMAPAAPPRDLSAANRI